MLLKSVLLVVLLSTFSGPVFGMPLDEDDRLEDIGIFSPLFFAELQDVELVGNLAYVFGVGGLAVLDISNPEAMIMIGRYEPPGHPYDRFYRGAVEGSLALGGGREDLLSVMDLSGFGNPTLKTIIGQTGQSYEGVALRNGIGYACRHSDGLELISFDGSGWPAAKSEVTGLVNSWDVDLMGDYAYVADGAGGLAVVNVADPAAPLHLVSMPTSGSATDVVIGGNLAVVCCGSAGIDVFNLDDPTNPLLVGHANTSGLAITASISNSMVYVADWDDVETFDLTDPSNPLPIGGENTPIRAMGLVARDDIVLVADWSRLRAYRPGPSTKGDIELNLKSVDFGNVPVGSYRDTTITIGNTGGSNITVSEAVEFSDSYSIISHFLCHFSRADPCTGHQVQPPGTRLCRDFFADHFR